MRYDLIKTAIASGDLNYAFHQTNINSALISYNYSWSLLLSSLQLFKTQTVHFHPT